MTQTCGRCGEEYALSTFDGVLMQRSCGCSVPPGVNDLETE